MVNYCIGLKKKKKVFNHFKNMIGNSHLSLFSPEIIFDTKRLVNSKLLDIPSYVVGENSYLLLLVSLQVCLHA